MVWRLYIMDLSSLNNKQLEAVQAPMGPVLVLAGAGSGKTRALSYRIAWLCGQKLVDAGNILALTFTNKAAKEMGERVRRLLEGAPVGHRGALSALPTLGTFHSVCAKILRREIYRLGYTRSFTIYDADDQGKAIKDIIGDLHIDKRYSPGFFRHMISTGKNILQTPDELDIGLEPDLQNLVREVYSRYQNYLFRQNGTDFDDLLMLTVKIFQSFPEVLQKYQDQFKYILVDEYQDTNHAQYVFLRLLAHTHKNLFVVGDDAQSIYGFRGSSIRNILNFEADYPQTVVIKLEQNYRSTQNILAAAQKVIELNPEQKPKKLWTQNAAGRKIQVAEQIDEAAEAEFVAKNIIKLSSKNNPDEEEIIYEQEEKPFSILDQFLKKAKSNPRVKTTLTFLPQLPKQHASLNDFAVLFRTHAQSRALEEVFIESGIPYQIVGGLKFYQRKEIKDVLAYLRLALNYRDLISLKRVINEPARGIGDRSFQLIRDLLMNESLDEATQDLEKFGAKIKELKFGPKIGNAVDEFFLLIRHLSALPEQESLCSLMRLAVKRTKYEQWLRDGTEMGETRWENVEELFTVAEKFSGLPWRRGLESFLEEVALITEIDEQDDQKDCVTLMTLHSAKGLEFNTVFLVGLEEGVLPHSRSLLSPAELSEEVRLAYVGLTRARQNLFLTFARRRRGFGSVQYNQPSRILRALPRDNIEYKGSALGESGGVYYDKSESDDNLDF